MLFGKFEPLAWINFAENERVCVHMRARTHARARTPARCLHACMHVRTHARTYVRTHMHAHMHVRTQTHTSAQTQRYTTMRRHIHTLSHMLCHELELFFPHGSLGLPIQREPQPEAAVSFRTVVTLVTWLISRTEFSSSEIVR